MDSSVQPFIESFKRAIALEVEAIRQRMGTLEIRITEGFRLKDRNETRHFYGFKTTETHDRLIPQMQCSLVHDAVSIPVVIEEIQEGEIVLSSADKIGIEPVSYVLEVYPWFLYEKLDEVLDSMEAEDFFIQSALTLFGKRAATKTDSGLDADHDELNETQRKAVRLCTESSLAFIWGPPGTGKTTTLAHIILELLGKGHRILVTSTTNAAVDEALSKFARLPAARTFFEEGRIVRVGQTSAPTFGAGLREVALRLHASLQEKLERLEARSVDVGRQIKCATLLLERLNKENGPQLGLFSASETRPIHMVDAHQVFGEKLAGHLLKWPQTKQQLLLSGRLGRLEKIRGLLPSRMARCREEIRDSEAGVIGNASVVLATMTNMYVNPLLIPARFDVVIVEEAGMALLPVLFYCAALAGKKVIAVGDPNQLPSIIQSRSNYVYRAMGRNIFDVAKTQATEFLVMLDLQYRMHPVIGDLVSGLFYEGKLLSHPPTVSHGEISAFPPFPNQPLVIVDTEGRTTCEVKSGSFSRFNRKTAQICVELAMEMLRYPGISIGIITPYVEQSRLIRKLLREVVEDVEEVECRTVHRFQGGERDVIILDTVDTLPFAPGNLLSESSGRSSAKNLINVSLSRARAKLVIVADVSFFNSKAPKGMISETLKEALKRGHRGSMVDAVHGGGLFKTGNDF